MMLVCQLNDALAVGEDIIRPAAAGNRLLSDDAAAAKVDIVRAAGRRIFSHTLSVMVACVSRNQGIQATMGHTLALAWPV